jgi:hypothetical protein
MLECLTKADPLSQVIFINDYIQLRFEPITLTLLNAVSVKSASKNLVRNDLGFCDMLCALIGQRILDMSVMDKESASFLFESGTIVRVGLAPDDATGPEAFTIFDSHGFMLIEQNT